MPPNSPSPRRPTPSTHQTSSLTNRTSSTLSEDPEASRPPQAPSPTPPEANAPPPAEEVTKLRLGAHYSSSVLGGMIGCLIRLGLNAMADYNGRVIFPLAWSQGVGCGIMGLALARKNEMVILYPPLNTFFTTGIAGCVTTFSSWMLEGYQAFSNSDGAARGGFHDAVDGFAYSFSTFAIALACIGLGDHVSKLLPNLPSTRPSTPNSNSEPEKSPSPPQPRPKHNRTPLLDVLTIVSGFLSYLIALLLYFLGPNSWRHRATFPILLSPPGAIIRFYLSRLNTRHQFIDRFPIGTFISNMSAALLISGVFAAQRLSPAIKDAGLCNGLYAIQQGFCGCLSTVSTFAVESRAIKSWKWTWIYVGGSVVLGHVFVLAIVGGVGWGEGYQGVCAG